MSGTKCTDCGISNATSWGQHDTGCIVAKAQRCAEVAAEEAKPVTGPGVLLPRGPIQERIDYYRDKYLGQDPHEVMVLIAIEEANRAAASMAGDRAEKTIDDYEKLLAASGRPIVRHGDVAAQLTNELTSLFRHYAALLAFEQKVAEAAQSPAAWLALRDEVRK